MTNISRRIQLMIAAVVAVTAIAGIAATSITPAKAAACVSTIYHWGYTAARSSHAIENARAGISWKRRVVVGARPYGPVKIVRCRVRASGDWQCQARQNVNHCPI